MAFSLYQNLGESLANLHITEQTADCVELLPCPIDDHFRAELDLSLRDFPVDASEAAVCEFLVLPVLREAVKPFRDALNLWSHVPLLKDNEVLGTPDYFVTKRSPLSPKVMELPIVMIAEAKRNDFSLAWAQCVAAMHAAQSLNGDRGRVVFGIASDGRVWEFGKLVEDTFIRHPMLFTLSRLDELFAALNGVLERCKKHVLNPASAA